ncbi:MAG: hypothetical protein ACI310_04950 [Bacilli bacterium]
MKKVFLPTKEQLYQMQDLGADIGLYLYAKAIEALCIEYVCSPEKESIIKDEPEYIYNSTIIANAICMMYPKELEYSEVARRDGYLAKKIITNTENRDIYRLDNISRFSSCVTSNYMMIQKTIQILCEELKNNPKYRFEYRDCKLLDDIFMCKINVNEAYPFLNDYERVSYIKMLAQIEPYYAIQNNECNKRYILCNAVIDYINRYGFNFPYPYSYEKNEKDILTNQSTKIKRLFKCINRK